MRIGKSFSTFVTCLFILFSSFLWYLKFDSADYSVLILVLSLIKYLFETALLGLASVPIAQMFITMKNSSRSNPYLKKIIQAPPLIQIIISGSIYVSFPIALEFFASRVEFNLWFLFPVILVAKLSFAICIAFMVMAMQQRNYKHNSEK
ncbi:MAG: hypothetical protein ACE3L7_33610 [Candidatus Pristimantibacillus sp.]